MTYTTYQAFTFLYFFTISLIFVFNTPPHHREVYSFLKAKLPSDDGTTVCLIIYSLFVFYLNLLCRYEWYLLLLFLFSFAGHTMEFCQGMLTFIFAGIILYQSISYLHNISFIASSWLTMKGRLTRDMVQRQILTQWSAILSCFWRRKRIAHHKVRMCYGGFF